MQLLGPLAPFPKQEKSTSHSAQRALSQDFEQDSRENTGNGPGSIRGGDEASETTGNGPGSIRGG